MKNFIFTTAKYLRIYRALFKASFIADLEYRANFALRILTDVFWYAGQIITFEALFQHTKLIGGWNIYQMRVFIGVIFLVDAVYMVLFHDNMDQISEKVRKGQMDLLLAKPVNSQFMVSLYRASTALMGNLLIATGWLSYSLYTLPNFSTIRLVWLFLVIPAGIFTLYTIRFVIATTAVIFTKADSIQYLWYNFYRLGMRPDRIYQPWLRYFLMTMVPVSLIASIPAKFLLESPSVESISFILIVPFMFFWAGHKFWLYALSKYSSASS